MKVDDDADVRLRGMAFFWSAALERAMCKSWSTCCWDRSRLEMVDGIVAVSTTCPRRRARDVGHGRGRQSRLIIFSVGNRVLYSSTQPYEALDIFTSMAVFERQCSVILLLQ